MRHLKLIKTQKPTKSKLYTDNLIESGFAFIANYLSEDTTIEDVYFTSVCIFDQLTQEGQYSSTPIYIPDSDLWDKRVDFKQIPIKKIPITVTGNFLEKILTLKELYKNMSNENEDVPNLSSQEIFSYSNYLLFENFLRHLDGQRTCFKFPSIIETLNRKNLDKRIKECLKYRDKLIFAANLNKNSVFHVGIYN